MIQTFQSCSVFLLLAFGVVLRSTTAQQDVIYVENEKELYTDQQLSFYETILAVAEQIERSPELKAEWNERVHRSQTFEPIPPVFECDTTGFRSATKPTSVHRLMPGDIDVVAAFGDSISAGNGLGATTLLEVAKENRGEVFSIGGDATLETGVVTFPNIVKKFNPDVKGFSICAGQETYENKAWFNVAKPGGTEDDMYNEAVMLVERMKLDKRVNFTDDWKFLTFFVGGNDMCASCRRNYSAAAYYAYFESTLLYLSANMNRTIVNLVTMFDVTPLQNFSTGLVCDMLQWGFCDCARNWTALETLRPLQIGYHEAYLKLANDPRFKRDDFTVVVQPHLFNMTPPIDPATGDYIQEFLSPDCFHPNRIAHQAFAVYLWNTMLIPVGQKPSSYDSQDFNLTVTCPTPENPYIYTDQNSQNVTTSASTTITTGKITTVAPAGTGTNPAVETSIAADTTTTVAQEATATTHEPTTAATGIIIVDTTTTVAPAGTGTNSAPTADAASIGAESTTTVASEATITPGQTTAAAATIIVDTTATATLPAATTTGAVAAPGF